MPYCACHPDGGRDLIKKLAIVLFGWEKFSLSAKKTGCGKLMFPQTEKQS